MEGQMLFNIVLGIAAGLGGFLLNAIWNSQKELQTSDKDLAEKVGKIEVLVAGQYVTRDEFKRAIDAVFSKLDKISDKLDSKQDRVQ